MNISTCPMATFILMLVIISILLDSYVVFGLGIAPKNTVVLVLTLLILVLYAAFTIWLANETCYTKFTWISWLIIIYLVYQTVSSIMVITNPQLQKELRKEFAAMEKEFNESQNRVHAQYGE
uniref:Uncharacterized protein n=1 Tax=viral metagenome TaxID=1070528 RepID=A0A6C0EZA5_9ZZZZ